MFEQALCELVVSLSPDCILGMNIASDWEMFPLPSLIKQKACKSSLKQY